MQIPLNSALTAERYSLASQGRELLWMPEVRRTIAHVSQGGARPSHAGAEKRDKLCVTLGEQTAPAATLRRAALRSLYLATPRFQAVTSHCEGEQQVSQNLEPSSAAECGRDLRRRHKRRASQIFPGTKRRLRPSAVPIHADSGRNRGEENQTDRF